MFCGYTLYALDLKTAKVNTRSDSVVARQSRFLCMRKHLVVVLSVMENLV